MRLRVSGDPSPTWFVLGGLTVLLFVGGCSSLFLRGQSPEPEELAELDFETRMIGDLVIPWGLNSIKVESVALLTSLNGTGSDPPPGPQRSTLISEMQTHEVPDHQRVLASDDTSLVLVRGFLKPGIQEGDRFDVEVQTPRGSKTKSLQGGWLIRSRLREMAVLDNEIHSGDVLGLAQGRVLVDALFASGEDKVHYRRGRVLGGGVALKSRPVGLVVRKGSSSIMTSKLIGGAINNRFHSYDHGSKRGVATPKRDNFIEVRIHPQYRHNIARYMRVIRSIAVTESAAARGERIQVLDRMLQEPTTAATAALQLEAIGAEALPALQRGVAASDPEVRFYAAEALAYLDEAEAVPALADAARDEPAFRWHALTALATMDHVAALDALVELLEVRSVETRYGAFRALRERNLQDPLVQGKILGDGEFRYHLISSTGAPLVHFSRSRIPEIVLFAHEQQLRRPAFLFAGKRILIKGLEDGRVKVSRFGAGQDGDQSKICSSSLDEIIRAIVDLGGGYEDVMLAVHSAKQKGYLEGRVAFEALPRPGRRYRRESEDEQDEPPDSYQVETPWPDMFANLLGRKETSYPSPGAPEF